ncbi:MAG: 4-amino-4-deoxychorismate lyase [Oleiphilaceae bacterium]
MKRPAHITLVNGIETSAIDIADRGLAYGDGLFETMRVQGGEIPLLLLHLKRFLKGVNILGLGQESRLKKDFLHYLEVTLDEIKNNACLEDFIIKMMVTRGNGGRGYVPPDEAQCHFIAQVFDLPFYPESFSTDGMSIRECQYRLGYQPQLAGIKHLNRLDQVLASQELHGAAEGLLLDYEDRVIEGTKSNLLVFKGGNVITPSLASCGVHGVLREELLNPAYKLSLNIVTEDVMLSDLSKCNGLAMINSVFGIWFVKTLILQGGKKINYKKPANYGIIQAYLAQHFSY